MNGCECTERSRVCKFQYIWVAVDRAQSIMNKSNDGRHVIESIWSYGLCFCDLWGKQIWREKQSENERKRLLVTFASLISSSLSIVTWKHEERIHGLNVLYKLFCSSCRIKWLLLRSPFHLSPSMFILQWGKRGVYIRNLLCVYVFLITGMMFGMSVEKLHGRC